MSEIGIKTMLNRQIDIKHLRLIKMIVDTGTLSAAAKQLNLSQSALSHQLKNIETYCEQALFIRHGKKMLPTPASRRFLNSANRVLDEIKLLSDDMAILASGGQGSIRLSSECYTSFRWMPRVISSFNRAFPEVSIQIDNSVPENVMDDLNIGKIDLAIMMQAGPKGYRSNAIFDDDLVLLVEPGHALSNKTKIDGSDLVDECLISYVHGREKLYQLLFGESGLRPRKEIDMSLTEGILEWCASGLGVAVLARWAAKRYIDNGDLLAIPLSSPWAKRTWYAVSLDHDRPEYLNRFVETMRTYPPTI